MRIYSRLTAHVRGSSDYVRQLISFERFFAAEVVNFVFALVSRERRSGVMCGWMTTDRQTCRMHTRPCTASSWRPGFQRRPGSWNAGEPSTPLVTAVEFPFRATFSSAESAPLIHCSYSSIFVFLIIVRSLTNYAQNIRLAKYNQTV